MVWKACISFGDFQNVGSYCSRRSVHYICKWLDGKNKSNKQPGGCFAAATRKEESPNCAATRLGDFVFVLMDLLFRLCAGIIAYARTIDNIHFLFQRKWDGLKNSRNIEFSRIQGIYCITFSFKTVKVRSALHGQVYNFYVIIDTILERGRDEMMKRERIGFL